MFFIEGSLPYQKGNFADPYIWIGINYKSPIVVEESNEIIFFPTSSPRVNNCYWLSLKNIKKYEPNKDKSKIIFKNEIELLINISYGSLQNQILRSTMLESVLRQRKKLVL